MRSVPSCAAAAHPHDGTKKISTQIAPKRCGSAPCPRLPPPAGSLGCTAPSALCCSGTFSKSRSFRAHSFPARPVTLPIFLKSLKKKKRLFVVLMGRDELKLCAIFSALGTKRIGGTENICLIAPRKDCHNILGCISKLNWKSGIYSRPFDQGALQVQKSKNTDRWGLELSIRRIISSFNFSSANV